MESWGVRLTWLDCNQGWKKQALPAELCQAFEVSNVSYKIWIFFQSDFCYNNIVFTLANKTVT